MDIEECLIQAGYTVVGVARDMSEALAMASKHAIDLALMDVNLADGTSGFNTACALHSEFSIRSIIVSAQLFEHVRERSDECNSAGYLAKPFSNRQLIEAVNAASLAVAL